MANLTGFGSGQAQLAAVAASLREIAEPGRIDAALLRELAVTARPLAPMVRAAILNIATTGDKHTGLRERIANCVVPWANVRDGVVSTGVEVQPRYMPDGEKALPLYMDGVKPNWRHPLFGNPERWYGQPPHPYFTEATDWYGPAARRAIDRVLDRMTATLEAAAR